MTAQEM
jgi:hypothetical protein